MSSSAALTRPSACACSKNEEDPTELSKPLLVTATAPALIMAASNSETSKTGPRAPVTHPLDPLTADEVTQAVALARELHPGLEFLSATLKEPLKEDVLEWEEGDPIPREVQLALHSRKEEKCFEMVVDLDGPRELHFEMIPGVQPRFMAHEYTSVEMMLRSNEEYLAALRKRGILDVTKVRTDLWSVGWFSEDDDPTRRLAWALCYYKKDDECEEYNYPIEGLAPLIDLNQMKILKLDDFRIAKVPRNDAGHFGSKYKQGQPRETIPLKPLRVVQPEGPSFTLEGNHLRWHFWDLRIGFTPREGAVLWQVGIWDKGELRPVMYRASISEMVVPYGSPFAPHYRKNAFDVSEDGIGSNLNPLNAGCDCSGEARFLDAQTIDGVGNTITIPNAICIHEEDHGILWKHTNWRSGKASVRRSRRLVISTFTTIANYDYGFYWYLGVDGTIEFEILLTGILSVRTMRGGDKDFGTNVARNPDMSATYHQHFLCLRLDMAVDGRENSVVEVNSAPIPTSENNPYRNAFTATKTLLRTEQNAQRVVSPNEGRTWHIVNPNKNNKMGYPVAYRLEPGENILPMMQPDSFILQRCPFITKHLWVTEHSEKQKYPAGDYPAQQRFEKDGIVEWTKANRDIDNSDIVVWYNFGAHHLPRPEDWPVMPAAHCGFRLRPFGFFDENPTLDLPPPACELKAKL